MPFVKLDCGILNSTIWFDRECREVFLTALLMAEPAEIPEALAQIEVNSLEHTGWMVPPGWYGFVPAAGVGIIRRAGVEQDAGLDALVRLGAPEQSSRSPEFDGRRLVRVDGGYLVLNYMKYRERDYTSAERSKRYRQRAASRRDKSTSRRDITPNVTSRRDITQAEAEAEVQAEKKKKTAAPSAGAVEAPYARSKRPIFRGQRFVVFEWMLDDLQKLLGPHCVAFDLHSWFYTLDAYAQEAGIVVPQRDGGKWIQQHTLAEAQRRGLVAAESPAKRADLPKQFVSAGPSARDLELIAEYEVRRILKGKS